MQRQVHIIQLLFIQASNCREEDANETYAFDKLRWQNLSLTSAKVEKKICGAPFSCC